MPQHARIHEDPPDLHHVDEASPSVSASRGGVDDRQASRDGIVVGVDESPGAAAALRWAQREAKARDLPLTAVLGWGTLDRHYVILGKRYNPGYDLQDADDALLALLEAALGFTAARVVRRKIVLDDASRALIAAAADADLLVVGSRGRGGFQGLLLGSAAEQCLHHALGPVAVVRPPAGDNPQPQTEMPPPARVIVGVDGSDAAQPALQWAIDAVIAHRTTLEIVHTWQPSRLAKDPFDPFPTDTETGDKAAQQLLETALERADAAGLPQPPTLTVAHGPTATSMVKALDQTDLAVVGSRGAGGFPALRLGSVSHQIARHAPCPVVVVPPASNDS